MLALRFEYSLLRLALATIFGRFWRPAFTASWAPVRMVRLPPPELPGPDWLRVRTKLAGICGSDIKQVLLKGAQDNPLTALISFPHVLGHEAVGVVESVGPSVKTARVGDRIVLNPWLSCVPRGIDPPCGACQAGDIPLCRNFDRGAFPPGLHLGNNAMLPGVFATYFVCHESQCHIIPKNISDDAALLADPFGVSLHSILQNPPPQAGTVLVYGLGTLGLLAVAILNRLFPNVEILAAGKYPHQAQAAKRIGAKQVYSGAPEDLILRIGEHTKNPLRHPWKGLPFLMDGVDIVYDTVGSPESVETSLRVLKPRGRLVISGVEAPKRFEWTLLYFKEVEMVGSNAFGYETYKGERRHAMDIFLELASEGLDISSIITHHYPFSDWRQAFSALMDKTHSGAIKVAFDFEISAGESK